MIKTKLWYLQNISLFKELTPQELKELDRMTTMTTAKKGDPVYLPGDPSQQIYLLKSGRVKISRITEEGDEVILALLRPGEIFGEVEALDEVPHNTMAMALEDTQLCIIKREDFMALLKKKPDLCIRLTKLIGLRLRRIESRIEELIFRDVPVRLAHHLLRMAQEFGQEEGGEVRIGIRMTHQEMANLIGSTRETVTATLGEFRRQGLLRLDGRYIILTRHQELAHLAGSRSLSQA